MNKPRAIICDLDGTLCNTDHRQHFLASSKDWKGFFGAMAADSLNQWCYDLVTGLGAAGFRVVFMSGRDENHRIPTVDWLGRHKIYPYMYDLFMRPAGDHRKDDIVKEELYRAHVEPRWDVRMVIDDRASVVAMWRRIGLTCLQCAEGNF